MTFSLPYNLFFFFGSLTLIVLFSQQIRVHEFLFGTSILAGPLFSKSSIPNPQKSNFIPLGFF